MYGWSASEGYWKGTAAKPQPGDRHQRSHSMHSDRGTLYGQRHAKISRSGIASLRNQHSSIWRNLVVCLTSRGEASVEHSAQSSTQQPLQPDAKRRKTRATSKTRVHREANGVFMHNRRGADFQSGSCPDGRGASCPRNPHSSHQCNKCLAGKHGGNRCNLSPKEPIVKGSDSKQKERERGSIERKQMHRDCFNFSCDGEFRRQCAHEFEDRPVIPDASRDSLPFPVPSPARGPFSRLLFFCLDFVDCVPFLW